MDIRQNIYLLPTEDTAYANYKVDQADLRARIDAQDNKIAS